MHNERLASGFTDVDSNSTVAPQSFATYLEGLNRKEQLGVYRNIMFGLIDPRPNDQILDVGFGTGVDMRAITDLFSVRRIVGIDRSWGMIGNAIPETPQRLLASGQIEYLYGDAHRLDFDDNTFDASYSNRTFQHLENPRQALREMIRVTKSGGRIVIADTDWESLKIVEVTPETSETVKKTYISIVRNPYIAGQLNNIFLEEGVVDTSVYPTPVVLRDFASIQDILWLETSLGVAIDMATISEPERQQCLDELRVNNNYELSFDIFVVGGRKLDS